MDKLAPRLAAAAGWWFWLYPPLLAAAELQVAAGRPLAGLLLHGALALALIYHSALAGAEGGRRLALALLLVPLVRLVALALPPALSPLLNLAVAGVGMLAAAALALRALRLRPAEVGLSARGLGLQLMVMGCGVAMGYVGAALLRPEGPAGAPPAQALGALALALLVCAGFGEELIFRGLLQTVSGPLLGRWGPAYVALVFAAAQLGFGSPLYALFAFIVGLAFAGVVRLSGSIVGVALAHGLASVVMVLVMPFLQANPASPLAGLLAPAMVVGGACAALAVLLLALGRLGRGAPAPAGRPASAPPLSAAQVARLRRDARLTYVALALRTGLPARLLAEIELGLAPLDQRSAALLAEGLGYRAA